MKKLVFGLVAVLGLSAPAFAQSYAGIMVGYPAIGAQFGVQNAISADLGFRVSARYALPFFLPTGTGSNFVIEGDVTYNLPAMGTPGLSAYVGAGPAVSLWSDTSTTTTQTGTSFGLGFVAGVDYTIAPNTSIFIEANPNYFFTPVATLGSFNFAGGLGVHFRF